MSEKPIFICLTPVKNEEWILESFIKVNSSWADYFIILDQNSTDRTREIAKSFSNVILEENNSSVYDEGERQIMLLESSRKIQAEKRILIALDSDEVLSANIKESLEWETIKKLPKGTIIKFPWVNINPDKKTGWVPKNKVPFGFVDDYSKHNPLKIHSPRVPCPAGAPVYETNEIVNLHFQYIDPIRNRKKQRWYMCWELLNSPNKHPVDIYRQYNKLPSISPDQHVTLKPEWVNGLDQVHPNIFNSKGSDISWWDIEIIQLLEKYGVDKFRKLDIWDIDWSIFVNEKFNRRVNLSNRQRLIDKICIKWLSRSQSNHRRLYNRVIQKLVKIFWN